MSPIKNVVLVGAGGNIFGPHILTALCASPQNFNITLLTRPSSIATLPSGFNVIKHDYDDPALASVLKDLNIHAMIVSISSLAILKQHPLINACAASGTVRRYIPTEYGSDSQSPTVRELLPIYKACATVLAHLKSTVATNPQLSWTAVATGLWLDFATKVGRARPESGYSPYNIEAGKAVIWDEGGVLTSYTTLATSALAVVRVLEREGETANKFLYVAEMTASQNEILGVLESVTGKKFERERKSTEAAGRVSRVEWKKAQEEWEMAGGEEGSGRPAAFSPVGLLAGLNAIMYGPERLSDWRENDNALLGIETLSAETMVKKIAQA